MSVNEKNEKIAVGMSGGVDSSVAAMLLKREGYNVTGVTLLLTDSGDDGADDAKKAAHEIGIEHRVYDLRETFAEKITDYFVNEYISGATPNPCVICNREIKFGEMRRIAHELGAEKIATGHYASVEYKNGRYLLKRTASSKDQTYFLSRLSQQQLAAAVFPLAGIEKDEIRKLALEAGLKTASKPDSQEVCFIPENDYAAFICRYKNIEAVPGSFIDKNSDLIGRHKGIINYTIGQRKGLGAFGRPMFVTAIDAANNTVMLGEESDQYSPGLIAEDMNWIAYENPPGEFRAEVRIRFRAKPAAATIQCAENRIKVMFDTPQKSVAPGQTVVMYDGDYVLGGGRILSAVKQP